MNSCNFFGSLTENPQLEEDNGSRVVRFWFSVEEYRKDNKTGERKKIFTTVPCEIWDTGAEYIVNNCKEGTQILLETSARFDEEEEQVYFRVNSFRVIK